MDPDSGGPQNKRIRIRNTTVTFSRTQELNFFTVSELDPNPYYCIKGSEEIYEKSSLFYKLLPTGTYFTNFFPQWPQ